jgi:hypothetical protein
MDRNRDDRAVVKRVLRKFFVSGPLDARSVDDSSVSSARLNKAWNEDTERHLGVWELRHLLPKLVRVDREEAIALLSELLDLDGCGLALCKTVQVQGSAELDREVFEAAAAAGELAGWRARRGPVEEGIDLARAAEREVEEAKRAIEMMVPQQRLAGVR